MDNLFGIDLRVKVNRSNCADCLDRTNAVQVFVGNYFIILFTKKIDERKKHYCCSIKCFKFYIFLLQSSFLSSILSYCRLKEIKKKCRGKNGKRKRTKLHEYGVKQPKSIN